MGEAEVAKYVVPYSLAKITKITLAMFFLVELRACPPVAGN